MVFQYMIAAALASIGPHGTPAIEWRVKSQELLQWIPLQQTKSGLLIVDVSVNGVLQKALIDTGTSFFVVSDTLVSPSDIISDGYNVKTSTRSTIARVARLKRLDMGPVTIANSPVVVADLSNLARSSGDNIKFILGSNILKTFAIEIDRSSGRMRFLLPSQIPQNGVTISSPLVDVDDAKPIAEVSICGLKSEPALIDTGYNNFLTIQDRPDFPPNCVTKETEGYGVDFIGLVARKRATLRFVSVFAKQNFGSDASIFDNLNVSIRTDKSRPPMMLHATVGLKALPSDHFIFAKGGGSVILF